jgi:transposase-like protein
MTLEGELALVVRAKIIQRLHENPNKVQAALVLGVGRQTLYSWIRRLNIQPAEWGADYQGTGSDSEIALAALRQILREEASAILSAEATEILSKALRAAAIAQMTEKLLIEPKKLSF